MTSPVADDAPCGTTGVLDLRIDLLCPIDLDFEPDVERLASEDQSVARVQPGPGGAPAVEMPRVTLGRVCLDGEELAPEARVACRVFRFGTGIVRVSCQKEAWTLAGLARVAERTEQITIGGRSILDLARALGEEVRTKLRPYAVAEYEVRIPVTEAYPVFRIGALAAGAPLGNAFVAAERRALAAITGVPGRVPARLSSFALETAEVKNVGALVDDVVVIREAGTFVHVAREPRTPDAASEDAKRIEGLVELAYAQYWSLRSVDELIQTLQTEAYRFIRRLSTGRGSAIPMNRVLDRLYRSREEHMAVAALLDDFLELPAIGYDVYLDAVFREAQRAFGVAVRSRLARDRLEDLERSFEIGHQIVAEKRLLTIEVLVLLVIVLELLLAIFAKH